MGNNNNNNKNPATPDSQTQSTNGAQNRTSVVAVDASGNPIVSSSQPQAQVQQPDPRTGNLPNSPPGGNTNAIPKPGEPTNPPAPVVDGQQTGGQGQPGQQPGLDVDKLISESTAEIKTGDEAQNARVEKQKMLMTALNSKNYMETVIYKNEETDEEVGRKLRYVADPYGKTIYDYMNDPEVTAHIGFKVNDNDPRDGSFIDEQISIYWINPVF